MIRVDPVLPALQVFLFHPRRWGRRWTRPRRPFLQQRSLWRRRSSIPHAFRHHSVRRTLRHGFVPDRIWHSFGWWSFPACFRFLVLFVFHRNAGATSSGNRKGLRSVSFEIRDRNIQLTSTSEIRIGTGRTEASTQPLTSHQLSLSSPDTTTTSSSNTPSTTFHSN